MRSAPKFWTDRSWPSRLLLPISWVYGAISGARMRRRPRSRANIPVIAIGNFTAGGAGKTPAAIAITKLVTGFNYSPIVLMRGYDGRVKGPKLVDARHDTARDVGDEALMIAQSGLPVIVSRNRAKGAEFAIACGCDLIIMDDGFQSPTLAKDLSFVVIDDVYGVGNGQVLPAGPLRAPLQTQLDATDGLIIISNGAPGQAADDIARQARALNRPTFNAFVEPTTDAVDVHGRHVVAFAGIGRPEKLAEGLRARGAIVEELVSFPDHHRFRPDEARDLLRKVEGTTRLLITTAKDMARLASASDPDLAALAARAKVASIRLRFDAEQDLMDFLSNRLMALGAHPRRINDAARVGPETSN